MEFDKLLNMLQELLSEKGWQTPSQDGTYQDEPILRPAAKVARPKAAKFRELRQIQRSPEAYWRSGDWLFYQQAKCMEDYTETGDSDISFTWASSTHASYASYATLTDKQLTAYFIWRTKVRQETIRPPFRRSSPFTHSNCSTRSAFLTAWTGCKSYRH